MRMHATSLLVLVGMALAGPASAQGEPPGPPPKLAGFVLGGRLGLATPAGKATSDAAKPISRAVPAAVPFELDVGGRFPFGLGLSGYLTLAPGIPDCPSGETCSAAYLRLGVQAEYRFGQGHRVMPWVGAGFGWEWFSLKEEALGQSATLDLSGPEFSLQGGVDFRLGRRWAIGPYFMASFSRYDHQRLESPVLNVSESIPSGSRTGHAWLHLGARTSVTF